MIRDTSSEESSDLAWFKSSYSSGSEGNSCLEIAATPDTVHVRDSKHPGTGPRFHLSRAAWSRFVRFAVGSG
jgi:hypothetical protein